MMANHHNNVKLVFSLWVQIITYHTVITCSSLQSKDSKLSLDNEGPDLATNIRQLEYLRSPDTRGQTDNKALVTLSARIGNENNDTRDFRVIKEVTVEEILDLEPEPKLQMLQRLGPAKPEDGTMDLIAAESSSNIEQHQHASVSRATIEDLKIKRVVVPRKQVNSMEQLITFGQMPNRVAAGGAGGQYVKNKLQNNSKRANYIEDDKNKRSQVSDSPPLHLDHAATTNVSGKEEAKTSDPVLSASSRESKQLTEADNNATSGTFVAAPAAANYQDGLGGRTRITLNAGYIRNKNHQQQLEQQSVGQQRDKIGVGVGDGRLERFHNLPSAQVGGSKVIFVPDRIILSDDIIQPTNDKKIQLVVLNNGAKQQMVKKTHGKPDSRCPRSGTITLEHPNACDKYFYCDEGNIIEQTCPNGLLYGTKDVIKDYCVYRWTANCIDKTIPNPISSPGCRWQYGIFMVQGSPKCSSSYYECTDGKYKIKKCSLEGQVYDDRSKSCKSSSMIGCGEEAVAEFHCPPDDQGNTYWPFPRYYFNEHSLIHCINEKPELVKCNKEERVDPIHLHCVSIAKRLQINKQESRDTDATDGENERAARERKLGTR